MHACRKKNNDLGNFETPAMSASAQPSASSSDLSGHQPIKAPSDLTNTPQTWGCEPNGAEKGQAQGFETGARTSEGRPTHERGAIYRKGPPDERSPRGLCGPGPGPKIMTPTEGSRASDGARARPNMATQAGSVNVKGPSPEISG